MTVEPAAALDEMEARMPTAPLAWSAVVESVTDRDHVAGSAWPANQARMRSVVGVAPTTSNRIAATPGATERPATLASLPIWVSAPVSLVRATRTQTPPSGSRRSLARYSAPDACRRAVRVR